MPENAVPAGANAAEDASPFDRLIGDTVRSVTDATFTTAFRGYDKDEDDASIAGLNARLRKATESAGCKASASRRPSRAAAPQATQRTRRGPADPAALPLRAPG